MYVLFLSQPGNLTPFPKRFSEAVRTAIVVLGWSYPGSSRVFVCFATDYVCLGFCCASNTVVSNPEQFQLFLSCGIRPACSVQTHFCTLITLVLKTATRVQPLAPALDQKQASHLSSNPGKLKRRIRTDACSFIIALYRCRGSSRICVCIVNGHPGGVVVDLVTLYIRGRPGFGPHC